MTTPKPHEPPPGVDPATGEITHDDAEVHVRPFAEMLTILDRGAAHDEASRSLHDLIAAVVDLGRKGSLTIAIEVSPLKGMKDQVVLTAQVTTKMPKADATSQMFFVDQSGNLTRSDPRQPQIEGLTIVETRPNRVVGDVTE